MKLSRRSRSPALFRTDATVMPMNTHSSTRFAVHCQNHNAAAGTKFPLETWLKVKELYQQGWSLSKIAPQVGMNRRTLLRHIRRDAFSDTIAAFQPREDVVSVYQPEQIELREQAKSALHLHPVLFIARRIAELHTFSDWIRSVCICAACIGLRLKGR